MKRREFFAATSSMMLPVMLNGFDVKSLPQNSALVQSLMKSTVINNDRIVVIIYLNGGNDGLNTVIPLQYYDEYFSLRENIAIPRNKVLSLSGNDLTGLHPAMTGMKAMYDEGKLAIIHSVSYPDPNQSHIRSSDIWMTAVDSNKYSSSGWAGRYLQNRFENYPQNYPNDSMADPLAVQIGYMGTTALLGDRQSMQITIKDPATFYQLIGNSSFSSGNDLPCCDAGDLISYVRQQQVLAVGYSGRIKAAAESGTNFASYPPLSAQNSLADQLKIVARLIHGGLQSKIYYVELGGFDTHAGQIYGSTSEGMHASLLKKLSDAVAAFQSDLKLNGKEDNVVGMTFSDFGRRATSNASLGTDHGIAAPMFIFGKGIKRQIVGNNPNLSGADLLPVAATDSNPNRDIKMQVDFRRVYSDVINDWFGSDPATTNSLLSGNFQTTSIFSDTVQSLSSGMWRDSSIWSNGRIPSIVDFVKINNGHVVEVGENINIRNIDVAGGGELKFLGNYNITISG